MASEPETILGLLQKKADLLYNKYHRASSLKRGVEEADDIIDLHIAWTDARIALMREQEREKIKKTWLEKFIHWISTPVFTQ